jgi:hypothetical protein
VVGRWVASVELSVHVSTVVGATRPAKVLWKKKPMCLGLGDWGGLHRQHLDLVSNGGHGDHAPSGV